MEIIVKTPLMADKIKALLDGNSFDGVSFAFIEKKGMEMTFAVSSDTENADAVTVAKSAIKATDFGKGIFFSVVQK